jgi:hypothetical protein
VGMAVTSVARRAATMLRDVLLTTKCRVERR